MALNWLVTYKNGISHGELKRQSEIPKGAVYLFTGRVIVVILSLESVVSWPPQGDKTVMKNRIKTRSGFPACVGLINGTAIALEQHSIFHGEDYFNRRSKHSMTAFVVGNDCKRILYNFCGFAGSVHDSRVFRNSDLYRVRKDFSHRKNSGDAAYPCVPTVVQPLKKPHSDSPRSQEFNKRFSSVRINIEHIFGMLEGRF